MGFFKWIGISALLLCGLLAGLSVRAGVRRRCQQAEAFLALLRHIRRQIDCFCAPQARIFAECDGELLLSCGINGTRPKNLAELLDQAVLALPENMVGQLRALAGELGHGYREEQLRVLDDCISRLSYLARGLRDELPKWERLAPVLPVALSAAVVLLLI